MYHTSRTATPQPKQEEACKYNGWMNFHLILCTGFTFKLRAFILLMSHATVSTFYYFVSYVTKLVLFPTHCRKMRRVGEGLLLNTNEGTKAK